MSEAAPKDAVAWQIEGNAASLTCGPLSAKVGCSLIPTQWQQQRIAQTSVLAVGGASDYLVEPYVRGNDFVASYAKAAEQSVTTHVYWRATFDAARGAAKIERVLSVQTQLLDSEPTLRVASLVNGAYLLLSRNLDALDFDLFPPGRTLAIDASGSREQLFIYRCEELGFTYAEMVHPADFVSAEAALGNERRACVAYQLFPDHLEKGVIRRGRICGWFLPVENDLAVATQLARQFVEEPLPLTT